MDVPVADAELGERTAAAFRNADDLLKRIIGPAGRGQERIARPKQGEQRDGQGVGAGDEVVAHKRRLAAKAAGQNPVQRIPAPVIVAVAGRACKVGVGYPVVRKRAHDPELVGLRRALQRRKHVF